MKSHSFFPPFLYHPSEMVLSISISATILPPKQEAAVSFSRKSTGIQNVKNLIKTAGVPSIASSPYESLQKGNWVKLICGASFEDVVDIRNLSLVYTLAGVDCIDCAADPAVVSAVNEGIDAAMDVVDLRRPWVMISVNDDEDLHFRKAGFAEFDPEDCPSDCSRPCEVVCPANAIKISDHGGVITERCYGCGRCFPVCPYDKISFFQLAGGTNAHTVEGLKKEGLFQTSLENSEDARTMVTSLPSGAFVGGVAFGGYARKIVGRVLSSMPTQQGPGRVEDHPELLVEALGQALDLVGTVKLYHHLPNNHHR
ncbi:hypothetical protein LINPERPRIM_LOCUS17787 [Linum perenne]